MRLMNYCFFATVHPVLLPEDLLTAVSVWLVSLLLGVSPM